MDSLDFDRSLRLQLCWLDGFPTTASHAGQRQCPHCRRKWSYAVLRRQWVLAEEFCKGTTRKAAARRSKTGEHTAGRHYKYFQEHLAVRFVEMIRQPEDGFPIDPVRLAKACRTAMKISDRQKRLRLLVDLCLGELPVEIRLEMVYRTVFRVRIQSLIRGALAARLRREHGRTHRRG